MARKIEYIDELFTMWGPFEKGHTKQLVEVALNGAYNQLMLDSVRQGYNDLDLHRKSYTGVAVTYDSTREIYYSLYPADIVPGINRQRIVNAIIGNGLRLYPTNEETLLLKENLYCNTVDTNIQYVPKRDRVEYDNMETMTDAEITDGSTPTPFTTTVRMDLIIQFKEYTATDDVLIPMGRDVDFKQWALDYLKQEPIIDPRND
jgi:hypothetical protein